MPWLRTKKPLAGFPACDEHDWAEDEYTRICARCMATEEMTTGPLEFTQPPMQCGKCGQEIESNRDRYLLKAEEFFGHPPSEKELEGFSLKKNIGLLACEACSLAAQLPEKRKRAPVEDRQERIGVDPIFVGYGNGYEKTE